MGDLPETVKRNNIFFYPGWLWNIGPKIWSINFFFMLWRQVFRLIDVFQICTAWCSFQTWKINISYLNYVTSVRLSIFFSDLLDKTWKEYFSNNSLNLILVLKSPWKYLKEPDVSGIERVTCLRANYLCYRLGRHEETFFRDFEELYIGTGKPLKNTDLFMT